VVVTGADGTPVMCLQEEGRPETPTPLEAVLNSSVESSVLARSGDGGPLWVEPMKAAPESFLMGERLSHPKILNFGM
jgi:hypothetical protein